jgi:hypothetical protein
LRGLASIGGVFIKKNSNLTSIAGFGNAAFATEVDTEKPTIEINGNPMLASLKGLEKFTDTSELGLVSITGSNALTSLEGLSATVKGIGGLTLGDDTQLTDLSAVSNVQTMGWLELERNSKLTTLEALGSLTRVDFNITIQGNGSLTSLAGLDHVVSTGWLDVSGNPALTSLGGLAALKGKVSSLEIHDNDQLTTLAGLGGLTEVTGRSLDPSAAEDQGTVGLVIEGNETLNSLSELSGLTHVGFDFQIYDNPALSGCEASDLAKKTGIACSKCTGNKSGSCP